MFQEWLLSRWVTVLLVLVCGAVTGISSFSWVRMTTQVHICCTVVQAEINRSGLPGKRYWPGPSFASSSPTPPPLKPGWRGAPPPRRHHERGTSSAGSALYIVSICRWETSSGSQVIKLHCCFQWHSCSREWGWQLCESAGLSAGSPSAVGQLESVFSPRCPQTAVRLTFLWMWLKNVCVLATITNKLCWALQRADQERAWPHYQNATPDGEESLPNDSLSFGSTQTACQSSRTA